jgi:hypothetical protein
MKNLWQKINFSPTAFELPEKDAVSGDDTTAKLGGDQEIIDSVNFNRNITHPELTQAEKEKISAVKITNFPPELSDEEILDFLKKEVSEEITENPIQVFRSERSSQVQIEAGPNKELMFKAADILDFKKTRRLIYPGRPLYLRLVRNLTPEKLEKLEIQSDPKVKEIPRQIDMNGKLKEKKITSTSSASAAAPQVLKYKQLKVNPSGALSKSIK